MAWSNPGKKSDFRNSSQAPMRLGDQPCYQHTAVRMQHARGAPPTGRTPQPWLNHRRDAMADPSPPLTFPPTGTRAKPSSTRVI